jgi:hypothetical protein
MMGVNFGIILNAGIVILACSLNAIKSPMTFYFIFFTSWGLKPSKITWLNMYIYFLPILFFGKIFQVQKLPHSTLH